MVEKGNNQYHILFEQSGLMSIVVTCTDYPDIIISQILKECILEFQTTHGNGQEYLDQEIQMNLKVKKMEEYMQMYGDGPIDKMTIAQNKIDQTKEVIQGSVQKLLQTRTQDLDELEKKSQDLKEKAFVFKKQARKKQCQACCNIF